MRKLYLTFCFLFLVSGLVFAQTDQLTIGWQASSVTIEAGVTGEQVYVILNWQDNNEGIWSFQVDITKTSGSYTPDPSEISLYGSLSVNFNIKKTTITDGVRVLVYGRTKSKMFPPGYNSPVLVISLPSLSAGVYQLSLSNPSAVKRDYPGASGTPQTQSVTLNPDQITITASAFTPPTFTTPGYTSYPRKYGDINWDTYVNVADVTGLADVVIENYANVQVTDPIGGNNWHGTYRHFYETNTAEASSHNIVYNNANIDNNDRTAADVYGGGGTLDLMDLATLEDAVTSGVWPSYAISAIANKPAYKINGGLGIGSGILAKVEGGGARFEKVATDVFVKFEVFNSGQKGSKIRVTVDNNSTELRGLQIELASSVLPGKLDVWSLPDASGLKVAWKRNDFNKIVILVYADGGKVMKSGSASYVTIVVPNVTREQILGAEPKVIASIKNISYDVNYDVTEASGIVPLNYMLYQNYPNPFNPGTKIEFEVPEYSNVKLIIWNSLGQKVKEIYSGAVDPNRYSVYWDGKDENGLSVASGIYFVTMYARSLEEQGREFTMTRKMILMK
jgi:hypothetical protein